MRLLVTGGAGYIGSVVARQLLEAGHDVTVLDSLVTGHRDAVPPEATFVHGDVADTALTGTVLSGAAAGGEPIRGVLHFAAFSLVGESGLDPAKYYRNNVVGTFALLEAMREAATPALVFSSTAATYGEPEVVPIAETAPTRPTNAYGATKLAIDQMISFYSTAYGLRAASLRYFNVAGAYAGRFGWAGERHLTETHLIPLVLQVPLGTRPHVQIYGTDYPTPDGTAIRDYIHVEDLGRAHLLALDALSGDGVAAGHEIYNLGCGDGFSVREVIDTCREVTGHPIPALEVGRRAGDPSRLVASSAHIAERLGWTPEHDLRSMVVDAWEFSRSRAPGA